MFRSTCFALAATALVACGPTEPPAPPPLEIKVVEAVQQGADITLDLVGQTRGSTDIPIRARVQGFLESIEFLEGRPVEKDQLLYTIDPAPFKSKVVEAEGRVAEARTLLAKSKSDLDRIRPLAEMKAVSQQDLDGGPVVAHDADRTGCHSVGNLSHLANRSLALSIVGFAIRGVVGSAALLRGAAWPWLMRW